MEIVLEIFTIRQNVIEEALTAIGVLARCIGNKFEFYMAGLAPILDYVFNRQNSNSLLKAATMCAGDLAAALGDKLAPHLANFVAAILRSLGDDNASSEVKVQSIESLADMAHHAGQHFFYHLAEVMPLV